MPNLGDLISLLQLEISGGATTTANIGAFQPAFGAVLTSRSSKKKKTRHRDK